MNTLLLERLVELPSDDAIDSLVRGAVVHVKNNPLHVFDGREEDHLRFYHHYRFQPESIIELTIPRSHVSVSGNICLR